MNYAWVIDQTKCIGCHACSTACKSENDVPLGVHRTWVKAVEVGQFPEFCLIPTFRLPVLIHTRSDNAKWLNEIAHSNPLWLNGRH